MPGDTPTQGTPTPNSGKVPSIQMGTRIKFFEAGSDRTPFDPDEINKIVQIANCLTNAKVVRQTASPDPNGVVTPRGRFYITDDGLVLELKDAPPGGGQFGNTSQTSTATCPAGSTGSNSATVSANTLYASTQSAADALAKDVADWLAYNGLACFSLVGLDGTVRGITQDPLSGRICVWGNFTFVNGISRWGIVTLSSFLVLDAVRFAPFFVANDNIDGLGTNSTGFVAFDANSTMIIGATPAFLTGGTVQEVNTFDNQLVDNGVILSLPDGSIPGGYYGLRTFNLPLNTGSTYTHFGATGNYTIDCVLPNAAGTAILVGGTFAILGTTTAGRSVVVDYTGAIVTNFGGTTHDVYRACSDGTNWYGARSASAIYKGDWAGTISTLPMTVPTNWLYSGTGQLTAIAMQGSNIILGGDFAIAETTSPFNAQIGLLRIDSSGTVDMTFGPPGSTNFGFGSHQYPCHIAIDASGNILCANNKGSAISYDGNSFRGICRVTMNGAFDSTWVTDTNGNVWTICVLTSGDILIGGDFTSVTDASGTHSKNYIALLDASGNFIS
jgi:hypothetical protein